jgi:chemotaxis protein methyltransferase CheR
LNRVYADPGYSELKRGLIRSTGLEFYAERDEPLAELISVRLSVLGVRDCSAYAAFLAAGERGGAEMDALIAQLTIGETYFFRDEEQFAAIRDVVLPDILRRKRTTRQLLIWSAGCATGAEPYSLAILLEREFRYQVAGWHIGIHATDLNRSFLAQAAEGKFRAGALRCTSDRMKRECFSQEGLTWTIHPRYKQWVSFHYLNLMESEDQASFPWRSDFDLILCRNVMIYFAREVNGRLIGQFHRALGEGGWLVLGASEYSLENLKIFRTVNATGARMFQKIPALSAPGVTPPTGGPMEAPQRCPAAAPAPRAQLLTEPAPSGLVPADLDGLRHLADRGDWQAAAAYGQRLLGQHAWNAETHFYHALIYEKLGILNEPERSLRRAIYLDRNFAMAHYHLGLALQRGGQTGAAARSFGNVLKVLAAMPDLAIITAAPGVTATGLKELAKMHLEGSRAL